jgi:hypothetical protein
MDIAIPPNPDAVAAARSSVQHLLTNTEAFRALPPDQRRELAHNMVKVAAYIAAGERGDSTPGAAHFSGALAGPPRRNGPAQNPPPSPPPDTASQKMKESGAAANREAVDAFGNAIQKIDFPKFVSDLVHGTFAAIVDSSIKQMQAYADLVKNVAKSVDQYMKDNVSENQARDYLVDKYPNHLELSTDGQAPQVQPKQGADESTMPDFFGDMGLPVPIGGASSVDKDTIEGQLVPAARKRLAMDRQQMLATMVLMGVNRLIVTDGSIEASVLFDFTAKDTVNQSRAQRRSFNQDTDTTTSAQPGMFSWLSGYTTNDTTTNFTVSSSQQSQATSSSEVKGHENLTGKVNIRFRSETFPLDKMAEMIQPDLKSKIQGNTPAGAARAAAPAAPGLPPPAPPALPPLPSIGAAPR